MASHVTSSKSLGLSGVSDVVGHEIPRATGLQLSGLCAGVRLSDVGDHVVQQLVVNLHVSALVAFAVKLIAPAR